MNENAHISLHDKTVSTRHHTKVNDKEKEEISSVHDVYCIYIKKQRERES